MLVRPGSLPSLGTAATLQRVVGAVSPNAAQAPLPSAGLGNKKFSHGNPQEGMR